MAYISSVTHSVIINGEPQGLINLSKGLRQGDPLSPYLFLICAEGLSAMIRQAELSNEINGILISRGGPADDSLIFCEENVTECNKVLDILQRCEVTSGQKLNIEKTTMFLSSNTNVEMREFLKNLIGVPNIRSYENYLGLPSLVGRSKTWAFAMIKERVRKKLNGWKERSLSCGGKEILLKAVAQAVPTYVMSVFRLPKKLCTELEQNIRGFWWGHKGEKRKIHWTKWDHLCAPESQGGLGFRELGKFNEALIAKQGRRLLHNHSSLFYRVFKAMFSPSCSWLEANPNQKGSYAWQSIIKSRNVIEKGSRWRIGDGNSAKFWKSRWLPTPITFKCCFPVKTLPPDAHVAKLIENQPTRWSMKSIDEIFLPFEAEVIKNIPLTKTPTIDKLIWTGTKDRIFSVKSA